MLPVEAETPSWNEFAGMHLLWPGAMCLRLRLFGTRRLEVASGNKWKGDPQVSKKCFFGYFGAVLHVDVEGRLRPFCKS